VLLTNEILITISQNQRSYYKNLGYNIEGEIYVNVEHLPKGSKHLVDVQCDYCTTKKSIRYETYVKNISKHNTYACSSKCSSEKKKLSNLEKYGYEFASQSKEIKEKVKTTNLKRYGVTCTIHHPEIKDKVKKTNLEKYGHEFSFQSKEIKEKIKNTNLSKYGVNIIFKSDKVKTKTKETLISRYGVDNPMKVKEIKEKAKNTNIERYGVDNPTKNKEILNKVFETNVKIYGVKFALQNKEINDKVNKSNINKYGVTRATMLTNFKEKIIQTNIDKYGYKNPMQNNGIVNKGVDTTNNNTLKKYKNILGSEYNIMSYKNSIFTIEHTVCQVSFNTHIQNIYDRIRDNSGTICTICNPIGQSSTSSQEIVLKELLNNLNIVYIENDRSILKPRELDIYIPSHKLAIEFNGLYWHSEKYKDDKYHLNKTLECNQNGIQLLHIFEDEWLYKRDIVESIIKNKLGVIENKIYARKTFIKEVLPKDAIRFLDENHIQGSCKSKYKLGLYYNNELVSLMTFGYRKTNSKKEFELIRFCNKLNTNVVGAASKLFKQFVKNYKVDEGYIISYADISMFTGDMYNKLGFKYIHRSKPNYFWVVNNKREHRWKYNKQNLIKEGFDGSKTEVQIMHERGYYRIWGCGQDRYVYYL
jgi:hypothetical protein